VVFGLFDCDPDGINIMQTYRLGSRKLAHEHGCTVPEMQWLGVKLDDISPSALDDHGTLELNARDRDKARAMLARQEDFLGDALQVQCFVELRRMLILNMKAESQILDFNPGGVAGWIENRLYKELGIPKVEEMLMEIDS
jgi:meiotic recombination protein SPO11